jgi:hypothetical protein
MRVSHAARVTEDPDETKCTAINVRSLVNGWTFFLQGKIELDSTGIAQAPKSYNAML